MVQIANWKRGTWNDIIIFFLPLILYNSQISIHSRFIRNLKIIESKET